jgi:hypothetical protein
LGASKISNLSGYSKVGISGGSIISDYYPFGAMEQAGDVINLANGGFEFYVANLYPVGWSWGGQNKSWDANVFSVVNNPISAQSEGIGYAREGRAFLKLGSSYDAVSEEIDVMPNTEYIITAYANTKNLKSGVATIDVIGNTTYKQNITQEIGNDWQFKVGKFKTNIGVSTISLKLYAVGAGGTAGSEGNFYFDDIKIRPALNSRYNTISANEWYTTQSCRLYSKTDSLSCDYYEDSGSQQKGWYGYCLEYDRAPGDPNACILWYPVDKVKGDGIEEGAGYQGKAPVYYCTEATLACGQPSYCKNVVQTVTSVGQNKYWSSRVYQGSAYTLPILNYGYQSDSTPFGSIVAPSPVNNPYEWDSDKSTLAVDPLYNLASDSGRSRLGQIFKHDRAACSQNYSISMAAGATWPDNNGDSSLSSENGALGYWDECTINNYNDDTAGCSFTINPYKPAEFGDKYSFVIADQVNDPSGPPFTVFQCKFGVGYYNTPTGKYWVTWGSDGDGGNGTEFSATLQCESSSNKTADSREIIKNIFAKSYGGWSWQGSVSGGRYTRNDSLNWPLAGGNPPSVSNMKINGSSANVTLSKNGFVNLTFNTKVDSNQLPLVMYAVDWGDNSKTTVTGVEMRDRPVESNNPHSLYHLYSYWDLRAKQLTDRDDPTTSENENSVYCGAAGQLAENYGGVLSSEITCGDKACCVIQPKVQIKDNWGWYNKGALINTANGWDYFGGGLNLKMIIVTEK